VSPATLLDTLFSTVTGWTLGGRAGGWHESSGGATMSGGGRGRMGSDPQHEQADPPALANRAGVLADLARAVDEAWASFDEPRPREPELDAELVRRLGEPLPEGAGDAESALAD